MTLLKLHKYLGSLYEYDCSPNGGIDSVKAFINGSFRHPYDDYPILDEITEDRTSSFKSISFEFSDLLNQNKINAQIFGREKTPFSIWRKVQKNRVSLEQITDIMGFRIILDNIEDCYKALGIFHSKWHCIPGKFKDYISSPKINKYQSLHTAIIGPNKRPIEIQIRTMPMHEFAEIGVASHWKYKSSEKFNSLTWKEYDWLKDLVEIIEKNENP
jgi:GTP pyrophosphokinase/guanosine-3',5'-bis(diphosphate) 3'-pyrophosphohydrolase